MTTNGSGFAAMVCRRDQPPADADLDDGMDVVALWVEALSGKVQNTLREATPDLTGPVGTMSIAMIASEALGILRECDAEFYADAMRALVRDDLLIKSGQS